MIISSNGRGEVFGDGEKIFEVKRYGDFIQLGSSSSCHLAVKSPETIGDKETYNLYDVRGDKIIRIAENLIKHKNNFDTIFISKNKELYYVDFSGELLLSGEDVISRGDYQIRKMIDKANWDKSVKNGVYNTFFDSLGEKNLKLTMQNDNLIEKVETEQKYEELYNLDYKISGLEYTDKEGNSFDLFTDNDKKYRGIIKEVVGFGTALKRSPAERIKNALLYVDRLKTSKQFEIAFRGEIVDIISSEEEVIEIDEVIDIILNNEGKENNKNLLFFPDLIGPNNLEELYRGKFIDLEDLVKKQQKTDFLDSIVFSEVHHKNGIRSVIDSKEDQEGVSIVSSPQI